MTKDKPTIKLNSSFLSQNTRNNVRIQDRVAQVQKQKKLKMNQLSERVENERHEKDPDSYNPSFKPKINPNSSMLSTERRVGGFGTTRSTRSDADLFNASEEQWLQRRELSRKVKRDYKIAEERF